MFSEYVPLSYLVPNLSQVVEIELSCQTVSMLHPRRAGCEYVSESASDPNIPRKARLQMGLYILSMERFAFDES